MNQWLEEKITAEMGYSSSFKEITPCLITQKKLCFMANQVWLTTCRLIILS